MQWQGLRKQKRILTRGILVVTLVSACIGGLQTGCDTTSPPTEAVAEPAKELVRDAGGTTDVASRDAIEPLQEVQSPDIPGKEATPEAAPCQLKTPPPPISVVQGGRFYIPAETEAPGGGSSLKQLPTGWVAIFEKEKSRWLVRTDYKAPAKYTLSLALVCGAATGAQAVEVNVSAIKWTSMPKWNPGDSGPAAREHPRIWIDPQTPDTLWLWGGLLFQPRQFTPSYDLWKLDLPSGAWTKVNDGKDAPQLTTAHVALQPGNSSVLVHGGDQNQKSSEKLYELSFGDTPAWKERTEDTWKPNAGVLAAWIFDAANNRYIAACGFQALGGQDIHCRVSSFTPSEPAGKRWQAWQLKGPSGRYGFAYAYDKEDKRMIVFSGAQYPTSQQDLVNAAKDTWALELQDKTPTWTKLNVGGAEIPGRRNGCFALDPEGHRLFMFGGTANGRTSVPGLYALHLDRGQERWHRVSLPNEPPIRSSCIGIYDPKRKQILLGFGNSSVANYADFQQLQLAPTSP